VSFEYLDLADFIAIAAEVTGLDEDTVTKIVDLGLADSALHAPRVLAIAAGTLDEQAAARWLRGYLAEPHA
jgi:hypothetical protein